MSLLWSRPRRERRDQWQTDGLWEMLRRRVPVGSAGVPVDNESALRLSAVYACHDKLVSIVSTFPVDVYRRRPGGVREQMETATVLDAPSTDVDAVDWRGLVVSSWLLRGNAYGLVTGMRGASPSGVELVHPDRVRFERRREDEPGVWRLDGREVGRWPEGPLWHVPGKMLHPGWPTGVSVLEYARQTAGLGLASQKFAADFFAAGAHPTAALMNDKEVTNEDSARRVKERFMRAVGPSREPVVMGGGWRLERLQVAPEESQFLETIAANATDVARFFGVPAFLIDAPSNSSMTYSNGEQKAADLLKFTVNYWVVKLERALTALLPRPQFVRLNVDALLRSDLATRYKAHAVGIGAKFLLPNEARRYEDLPPLEGGDEFPAAAPAAAPVDEEDEPRGAAFRFDESGARMA